jgi:hypothetical protein
MVEPKNTPKNTLKNTWFSHSETYFLMLSEALTGIFWDDDRASQGVQRQASQAA